jgi:hypothetical protein
LKMKIRRKQWIENWCWSGLRGVEITVPCVSVMWNLVKTIR